MGALDILYFWQLENVRATLQSAELAASQATSPTGSYWCFYAVTFKDDDILWLTLMFS